MSFRGKSLNAKIMIGSVVTLSFLVALGCLTWISMNKMNQTNGWVDHTHNVINEAMKIEAAAVNMETGMRGYLLAGKEEFLEPYNEGSSQFRGLVERLKSTVSDNPEQVQRLGDIERVIGDWQKNITEPTIELRRQIGDAETMNDMAALVGKKRGKTYFDRFRGQVKRFIDNESVLLEKRENNAKIATDVGELRKSVAWVTHTHKVIQEAMKIEAAAVDMETGMRGYLLAGQEEFLDPYRSGKSRFSNLIKSLQVTVNDNPAQVQLLSEIEGTITEWDNNVVAGMIELRGQIGDSKTMDDMADVVGEARGKKYFDRFRGLIATFVKMEADLMAIRQEAAVSTDTGTRVLVVSGVLIAVVLSLLFSYFLSRSVTTQFQAILSKMSGNANDVARASDELATASRSLSSYTSQQASSVEETSSSMEEMSGILRNNVDLAKGSNELSEEVNQQMVDLSNAMSKIEESNEQIDGLVKIINEIGAKTEVIDEIVFQTKLLSFNASVEAERAGEHGRGFAVVAQEVGNLAQMSGRAAMEISSIVKDSTGKATSIVKENTARVLEGNRIVKDTLKQSETLSSSSRQIVDASTEQSKGISQISHAIERINAATQKSTSIAESTAASSQGLKDRASSLNEYVHELTQFLMGDGTGQADSRTLQPRPSNTSVPDNVVSLREQAPRHDSTAPAPLKMAAGAEGMSSSQEQENNQSWEQL